MPEVFDHNGMYTEEGKEIFRETYQLLKSDFRELHRNGYHVRDIESVYFDVVGCDKRTYECKIFVQI